MQACPAAKWSKCRDCGDILDGARCVMQSDSWCTKVHHQMSAGGSCRKKRATPLAAGGRSPSRGVRGSFYGNSFRRMFITWRPVMRSSGRSTWIQVKYSLEKLCSLCVVNKTCISLTTVSRNDTLAAELADEVKETANLLTTCEQFMKMYTWSRARSGKYTSRLLKTCRAC